MPSVTIIQRVLPHYRIPLFEQLHERLAAAGVSLRLVYGQEFPGTVPKTVAFTAPWATRIHNRYLRVRGVELVWQPCRNALANTDLVIVEQANRLLLNYYLLTARRLGRRRLAYWGHGRNMQARDRNSWREKMKASLIAKVDWWFAYTESSAAIAAAAGFPRDRISVVQNSIDTRELERGLRAIRPEQLDSLRTELGIRSENVCLYCGGIYRDKRIDFLLNACDSIRAHVADFHMIVIGTGPEQESVVTAARSRPWLHYVGGKYGAERLPYFKISRALLMPGAVGLVVLDSLVTRVPMFTTDIATHGPEVSYLESGVNGGITPDPVSVFARAVTDYLGSPALQERFAQGCGHSASRYTLENMVDNFARGIVQALSR